ncbi:MAG: hypothetical protein IPH04_01370 [Saprospirales bacterium]|nr:hypothetical protein [Saprospirales bacterium]
MENFFGLLLSAFLLFVIGFLTGVVKAYIRKSPISKKEQLIQYHRHIKTPVFWSFVAMFLLVLLFGLLMKVEFIPLLQKATIAGLFTSGGIYIFLIWGANLIRDSR